MLSKTLLAITTAFLILTTGLALAQDAKKKRPAGYCKFEACVARGKAKGYSGTVAENWCRANNNAC